MSYIRASSWHAWSILEKSFYMNTNYSILTTLYDRDIRTQTESMSNRAGQVTYHEQCSKLKLYIIFFYDKYIHLGENTFIHCSRITCSCSCKFSLKFN